MTTTTPVASDLAAAPGAGVIIPAAPAALNLAALQPALTQLRAVESEIQTTLVERDEPVHMAILSLLMAEHIVMLGMPGTAKSKLITGLARRVSPPSGGGLRKFIYLMTKFTTPEEIFGPISVINLKKDDYRRVTHKKFTEAELVFLDEIFKANSAILNSLLRGMNEREFENGFDTINIPLISLFGASNEMPQGEDLAAIWDRFLIRLFVEYVSDSGFTKLLEMYAAAAEPFAQATITQEDLVRLQAAVDRIEFGSTAGGMIEQLRRELKAKGVIVSDRRWGQSIKALRAQALFDGRPAVNEDDLMILKHTIWSAPEQITEIGKMVARLGNPLNARAVELGDQAADVFKQAMDAQTGSGSDAEKMNTAIEAVAKIKRIKTDLNALLEQARAQVRATGKIEQALAQINDQHRQLAALVI